MFFLTRDRNMFAGKSKSFLAVLREHVTFNVMQAEVQKISEVFWAKLFCKNCKNFKNCKKFIVKVFH